MTAKTMTQQETTTPQRSSLAVTTPSDLLRIAVETGADLDRLEKLMDLQTRWETDQARKAYVRAMAEFKAEPIEITKDKHVAFGTTAYDHATIGNVNGLICAGLAKHGFSHRWNIDQQDSSRIIVTCIITHALGHSESTNMRAGADQSGGKNSIQAIASAVTYLQRYTLLAATGMATNDQADDDGQSAPESRAASEQPRTPRSTEKNVAPYPDANFRVNLPKWRALIDAGEKTADEVIATLLSKCTLSAEQMKAIRSARVDGDVIDAEFTDARAAA